MTWLEQKIRDRVHGLFPPDRDDVVFLLGELDRARGSLQRIKDQAQGHVLDKNPGWGRWETALRLAKEGLGE